MVDLLLFLVVVTFILGGLKDPAIALAGYLWADMLTPHRIGYGFIQGLPISEWLAITCFVSMAIHHRKLGRPSSWFIPVTLVLFLGWLTLTTLWAHHPVEAWFKWDWAFKSILFAILSIFIFHEKRHIELYMFVILLCVAYYAVPAGIKAGISGGGYGKSLLRGARNHGLSESSTLAGMSVAMLPIIFYLRRYSVYLAWARDRAVLWYVLVGIFLISVVGTHTRTGLVSLLVLVGMSFVFGKRRLLTFGVALVGPLLVLTFASAEWKARMMTIQTADEDASALGRLVVWSWTIDYAKRVPFGGGFDAYLDNEGQLSAYSNVVNPNIDQSSKAFHNIYFEVLGEHGYPGFFMYVAMLTAAGWKLLKVRRMCNSPDPSRRQLHDAATALLTAYACVLATGMFVGVAYRPYVYFFLVFSLMLENVARRDRQRIGA